MSDDLVKRHLLIKRGLYYAPDRQGYTGVKERAGRYHEVEALGLDGVTAIHEDEAPDFSPACWEETKIAALTDRIEAQAAEIERLNREVLLQMGWKTKAQNEVDELAAALDNIANESSDTWARDAARAALGDTQ